MISQELEKTIKALYKDARQKGHQFVSIEHLLLGLLDNKAAFRALNLDASDIDDLRIKLMNFVNELNDHTPALEEKESNTQPTLGFQRVIQRAIFHAQSTNKKEVDGADVLLAIFGEQNSHAATLLKQKEVVRIDVARFIATGEPRERKSEKSAELAGPEAKISVDAFPPKGRSSSSSPAPTLFISYSHADTECLNRLLVHLRPLQRKGSIICWSDKNIKTGKKWRIEIEKNLAQASIAILLISADFLASDFIVNNELPPMLMRAEAAGLRVLPVILKPCGFARDEVLSTFQAANDELMPLLALPHIQQEALYDKIAGEIADEIAQRQSST